MLFLDATAGGMEMTNIEASRFYKRIFRNICTVTGLKDPDNFVQVVHTFIRGEEENFALFNYVNELSNEAEKLNDEIRTLSYDIETLAGQGMEAVQKRDQKRAELQVWYTNTPSLLILKIHTHILRLE